MDAKTLTHAKRLSRFAVIAAVIFAALTLVITPARALAHGEGVLQIGNDALTGEGMVDVGEARRCFEGQTGWSSWQMGRLIRPLRRPQSAMAT